jgi:hypothetical protein
MFRIRLKIAKAFQPTTPPCVQLGTSAVSPIVFSQTSEYTHIKTGRKCMPPRFTKFLNQTRTTYDSVDRH